MTKFSDSIVNKIKCDQIKPVPKWHFLLKSYTFWTLFILSMILGSLSFSVMVHIAQSGDLDLIDHLQGNWLVSAVMLLPVFWLVSLVFFAALAFLNWKCTKKGYCIKRRWIVLGSILLSMVLGAFFYLLGLGRQTDLLMTRALPFYDQYKHKARKDLWQQPEKGLLTGKIIDVDEDTEKLLVRDEDGKDWIVDDRDIVWENDNLEERGRIVKVLGQITGESEFQAVEVRTCANCQDDEFVENVTQLTCLKPDLPPPVPGCAR